MAAALLSVMVAVVFLQVVFRYFLLQPLAWAEESARFLFIWVALLGAALGARDRAHFAVTMAVSKFPGPLQKATAILIAVGASFVFYIMIVEGWGLVVMNQNQQSPAIGVQMSYPYLAIPLSGLLMLIFTWADLIMHWTQKGSATEGEELPSLSQMLE